jgi:hypothetical protein
VARLEERPCPTDIHFLEIGIRNIRLVLGGREMDDAIAAGDDPLREFAVLDRPSHHRDPGATKLLRARAINIRLDLAGDDDVEVSRAGGQREPGADEAGTARQQELHEFFACDGAAP